MAKPLMVIVEPDESYLLPLEAKLVEALWENVDIEIISDKEYFEEYFTIPKKMDVLVIDSSMYTARLQMHNIDKTFVLTENLSQQNGSEEFGQEVVSIYKFSNLNVIANNIMSHVPGNNESYAAANKETKVIAVLSPVGGAGATTVSMGISAVLQQNLKKVLYVSLQMYQDFQFYLNNRATLPMEACAQLRNSDERIYEKLKSFLIKEGVFYLPPLKSSRESLGIKASSYVEFVVRAKGANDFDFVVVDIGNELTAETLKLLEIANKVYITTAQDSFSAFKLNVFRHSVNCNDTEKYSFVCNCFEKDRENGLLAQNGNQSIVVHEYIERVQEKEPRNCEDLLAMEGIQKLAYMLI